MIRDDVSGKEASHEVSETATAGELLQEACRLFGREELDSALEVDGAVVCTGVVGGVSGGEASVGSLGVHSDSSLVLCRSRDRVLAVVAGWDCWRKARSDGLPEWALDDEVVALAAVAAETLAFEFVSERLRNSDSFMRDAVERNGGVLYFANVELRADRQLVLDAVATSCLAMGYASDELKADKDFVLAAVAINWTSIQFAETFRADKQVVLAAIAIHSSALEFASDELKDDKELVLAVVANDGSLLHYASEALKADKELVQIAVAQDGWALEYASKELKADKHVVLTAVAQVAGALLFASGELKADGEVVSAAAAAEYNPRRPRDWDLSDDWSD